MAENNQDEIDLGHLFGKITDLFKSFIRLLFLVITFFVKYIIVIVVLIIVGVVVGYYMDKNETEVYNNELIVIPNFESTQYFYDKVNTLSIKIKNQDTVFTKKIFGPNYRDLKRIEAEPIVDIYRLASGSRERVDLFKALTEKQGIQDYLKDPQVFQYFKYQHLTLKIRGKAHSQEIVDAAINYLNDNSHYEQYKEVGSKNTQVRIESSEQMLSQIDSLLKTAAEMQKGKQNFPTVAVNDNSQLNDLLKTKTDLTYGLLQLNKQLIDEQQIVKVAAANYNVSDDSGIHISRKVKYPILLILIFSGFFLVMNLYRRMKDIAETHEKTNS
ncbi:hypothetical protein [Aequorivita capsosiphonis]|uniref:hypothetical protein n=1 Tax=Aequorivita capsosiphonis TaxID=487317 RepID=UPI0003F7E2A4|nr:hypothetical protein [Aequorivita capsosiphonis]